MIYLSQFQDSERVEAIRQREEEAVRREQEMILQREREEKERQEAEERRAAEKAAAANARIRGGVRGSTRARGGTPIFTAFNFRTDVFIIAWFSHFSSYRFDHCWKGIADTTGSSIVTNSNCSSWFGERWKRYTCTFGCWFKPWTWGITFGNSIWDTATYRWKRYSSRAGKRNTRSIKNDKVRFQNLQSKSTLSI